MASGAKEKSKAERGMKMKKGGSRTALPLFPRELLCPEGDKRRERGITYLVWFPPPSPSARSLPPPFYTTITRKID